MVVVGGFLGWVGAAVPSAPSLQYNSDAWALRRGSDAEGWEGGWRRIVLPVLEGNDRALNSFKTPVGNAALSQLQTALDV